MARPEVWGVIVLHITAMVALLAGFVLALGALDFPIFDGIDGVTALLIGFALSFSSTVFAIKILGELSASTSRPHSDRCPRRPGHSGRRLSRGIDR